MSKYSRWNNVRRTRTIDCSRLPAMPVLCLPRKSQFSENTHISIENMVLTVFVGNGLFRPSAFRTFLKIFMETFVLTFLAEWGDRSQVATVLLAAT